jgi:hypothetical protein
MQPTPLLATKQDQRLVKRRLSSILTVFSFLLEMFRRFNADFTVFETPNTTRATFSFETSASARKTLPYVDFDRSFFLVRDISTFKR